LPKYRGAAPIQYAVWQGEAETGVSIFQIEPKLDAGPVLGVVKTPIGARETAGDLELRLAELAVPLTLEVVNQIEQGTTREVFQDATGVTRAPRLRKEEGLIDWSKPAVAIDWHVRGMQPWPNPYTFLHRDGHPPQRLLVLEVCLLDAADPLVQRRAEPGVVVHADAKRIVVAAGEGVVELVTLRPEGKRAMTVAEFLCGHGVRAGDRFAAG
jgi:methionyl-tRNA formyltransferase